MKLKETFAGSRAASRKLALIPTDRREDILLAVADALTTAGPELLAANGADLDRMDPADPLYDRLLLSQARLEDIAADIRSVAALPCPVGEVLASEERPNGMVISKVRVPFGVVGVIYEARPNVSFDVFSLCFKTANSVILKGGTDAENSNRAIVGLIRSVLESEGVDPDCVILLPSSRDATAALLGAVGSVDVIIPRGSSSLIRYVRENSRVPVIETGAGICHTYFDRDADLEMGREIVFNAKTRRVSVCNALDTLVVHSDRLGELPALCGPLAAKKVVIYADTPAYAALEGSYPPELLERATESSFGTEFLDYKMSVRTVGTLSEAVDHIMEHTSGHSESIITGNDAAAAEFVDRVDAACVYHNVSTAFTDGAQFGMGAEIGISTQKLHARGPMGLVELTSYKYVIKGNGQTRD